MQVELYIEPGADTAGFASFSGRMLSSDEQSTWQGYYGYAGNVIEMAASSRTALSERSSLPRLALHELKDPCGARRLCALLARHGFVVLTDVAEGTTLFADLMHELGEFFGGASDATKAASAGPSVYFSERGVPMWHTGYERDPENVGMREAWRYPSGIAPADQNWPSARFRRRYLALMRFCQRVCDRCLCCIMSEVGASDAAGTGGLGAGTDADRAQIPPRSMSDDKSVSYAVFYPNDRGGQQSNGVNINAHRDPSLCVIEPVTHVAGLEIQDQCGAGSSNRSVTNASQHSERWIAVEKSCEPGKEFVLFGGLALERATGGRIRAALHRVTQARQPRTVFIFEQKYAAYFDEPWAD